MPDLSFDKLDLTLPGGTPRHVGLSAELAREISAEDIITLQSTESLGSSPAPLKAIRQMHHRIAQLLASGMKGVEISLVVGISQARISILKNDPAFTELLKFYEESERESRMEIQGKLKDLTRDAIATLHERIVDEPEKISTKVLADLAALGLDRTGHGPQTKTLNASVELKQEDLDAIKQTVNSSQVGKVNRMAGEQMPNSSGAQEGGRLIEGTRVLDEKETAEQTTTKGESL